MMRGGGGRFVALVALVLIAALASGCGGRKRLRAGGGTDGGQTRPRAEAPVIVRVGLEAGVATADVSWPRAVVLRDGKRRQVARIDAAERLVAHHRGDRIGWQVGERSGEVDALIVQPIDPEAGLVHSETSYPGEILLLPLAPGISVINQVELETYLRGVVPWEIGRPGEDAIEAVAAQAVAARTYTIAHLGRQQKFGFDVWADVRDQVYRGAEGRAAVCDEAIARTQGLVLRHGGREIDAYYCSTCGGVTSTVAEVWPRQQQPYLRSVTDTDATGRAYCADARYAAWTETWRGVELEAILARTLPDYVAYMRDGGRRTWAGEVFIPAYDGAYHKRPGALLGLEVVSRTTSGRVARLNVRTEAGVYRVLGDRVRWVMTPRSGQPVILRSAFFDLDVREDGGGWPEEIVARGRGFGHGVGLCQTGALARARRGQDYRAILAAYYPGATVDEVR